MAGITATREGRARRDHALLLDLLRGAPAPGGQDARWPSVIALAARHGVAPLLHDTVPSLQEALRRHRAAELANAVRLRAAEDRALHLLRGLDPVLLKGAAYARVLYRSPELRPRGDVDLLVGPAGEAARRLAAAGYRRHPGTCGGVQDDPDRHEQTLVDPADPAVAIDLHRAFCQPERTRIDVAALIARSVALPDGARVLDADDAVLAHALNLATHELRVPLIQLCDLQRLWRRCSAATVVERARQFRLERALACSLSLLEATLGGARITGPAWLRWMVGRYDPGRRPLGRLEQLARKALLIDRPLDRVRFALAHAAALLRTAARSGPPPPLLAWRGGADGAPRARGIGGLRGPPGADPDLRGPAPAPRV